MLVKVGVWCWCANARTRVHNGHTDTQRMKTRKEEKQETIHHELVLLPWGAFGICLHRGSAGGSRWYLFTPRQHTKNTHRRVGMAMLGAHASTKTRTWRLRREQRAVTEQKVN